MSSCLFLFVWESSSEHAKGEWSPKGKISLPFAPFVFARLCRSFANSGCQVEKGAKYRGREAVLFTEQYGEIRKCAENARKIGNRLRR